MLYPAIISEGLPIYACFLDASEAFDDVNHGVLFETLCDRGFPNSLTRFLLFWYKEQHMHVCLDRSLSLSDTYPIGNGVQQGGVLSPILFYSLR